MIFIFLLIYFGSGFSALIYQILGQRILAIFSGTDVYSITVIVSAFMAGLGAGSLLGGVLADKLSTRGQIAGFVGAELVIAGFGWPFTQEYYRKAGIDIKGLLLPFLERKDEELSVDPRPYDLTDINTDFFPKDEYGR